MNTSYDCADGRITDNGLLLSGRFDGRAVLQRRPSSDLTFCGNNNDVSIMSDNHTFRRSLKTQERRPSKDVIDILTDQDFKTRNKSLSSMTGVVDTTKKVVGTSPLSDSPGLLLQKKSRCSYSYSLQKIASLRPLDLEDHTDQHDSSMNSSSGCVGADKRNVRFEVEPATGAIVTHEIAIEPMDGVPEIDNTCFDLEIPEEKLEVFPKFVAASTSSVSTTSTSSSKRRGRRRAQQKTDTTGATEVVDAKMSPVSDPKYEAKKLQQFYDRRENRRAWRVARKEAGSFLSEDQGHVRLASELHSHWDEESKSDSEDSTNYIDRFYTQWAASDGRGLEHPIYISSSSASIVSAISDNEGDDEMNTERLLSPATSTVTVSMSTSSINEVTNSSDSAEVLFATAAATPTTTGPRARPKLITPGMAHKLAVADAIVAKSYCISD
jgi:hypothetical protein